MAAFSEISAAAPGVRLLETHPKVTQPPCYGVYFRYPNDERKKRAATLAAELSDHGVPAAFDMYRPVYRSPEFGWNDPRSGYVDYSRVSCPVAEKAADELIWIPHRFFMAPRG